MRTVTGVIIGIAFLARAAVAGAADTGAALDANQPKYESIQSISAKKPDGIWINPFIEVESNGTEYTKAKTATAHYAMIGEAKVSANKWRIADIAWGVGNRQAGPGLGGALYTHGQFYYSQKQNIGKTEHFKQQLALDVPVESSGLGVYATARCNAKRRELENGGMAKLTIFNTDRNITISVSVHFAARGAWKNNEILEAAFGSGDPNPYWRINTVWFELPVRCLRTPEPDLVVKTDPTPIPLGPDRFTQVVGVTQASLIMVPDKKTGQCPVPMKASATIVTNGQTEVKYRLESDKGELSPVATVTVDQTNTAFFVIDMKLGPKPDDGGPKLAAPQAQGIGGLAAAAPAPDVAKGFYQLRIVSPNQLVSKPASYEVKCLPTAGTDLTLEPSKPWQEAPNAPKLPATIGTNAPKPDLIGKGVALGGEYINVAPGLTEVIQASKAKSHSNGRCLFGFQVRVENKGQAATPVPFTSVVKWDAMPLGQFSAMLGKGEAKEHSFDAYLTPGTHALSFVVDSGNAVSESDEGNNVRTTQVRLVGPCGDLPVKAPSAGGAPPSGPGAPVGGLKTK